MMRIDKETDIDENTEPNGTFNITGVLSQFDMSSPYDEGYQIQPRYYSDFQMSQTIADIRTLPDGDIVTVEGIVTSPNFSSAGTEHTLQDETAGIVLFASGFNAGLNQGDIVAITGTVSTYNGKLEIVPSDVSDITVISSGNALPAVQDVSISDILTSPESYESELLKISNVSISGGTWPSSGADANMTISDGTGSFTMRIDKETDIDGSPAPTDSFIVIGIISQYDNSSPYTEGYQILPRKRIDIFENSTLVTFQADMRQLLRDDFDPAVNKIAVAGTFTNWAGAYLLFPSENDDSLYTRVVEIRMPVGTEIEWKFYGYPGGNYGYEGGENRTFTLEKENMVLDPAIPSLELHQTITQEVTYTFTVDLSNAVNAQNGKTLTNVKSVFMNGLAWTAGFALEDTTNMLRTFDDGLSAGDAVAGDNIWTTQITFVPGTRVNQHFKYAAYDPDNIDYTNPDPLDNEAPAGVEHYFVIDDSQPEQTLAVKWLTTTESNNLRINVSDATNSSTLYYGWSENGTDGYDADLDQYAPPTPPSGAFDARFSNDGEDYIKDIRQTVAEGGTIVWNLSFKASSGNAPIVLQWNPSLLPSDGTFTLQDPYGGSLVNINMRADSSYTDTDTAPDQLQILYSLSTDVDQVMMSGWNMVSLPVDRGTNSCNYLNMYPDAISNTLYDYNGVYNSVSELQTGKGYWLRFNEVHTYSISGSPINSKDIALAEGWNMIGGLSSSADISDPSNIVISGTLYGYNGTYNTASDLEPGKGYWLRASSAGTITLNASSSEVSKKAPKLSNDHEALVFENGSGQSQHLYFNVKLANNVNPLSYSLPPLAPGANLDCRFENDMSLLTSAEGTFTLTADVPVSLSTENVPENEVYEIENLATNEIIRLDKPSVTLTEGNYTFRSSNKIPAEFVVKANYPNPFNPTTTIEYGLHKTDRVQIKIYDINGKLVRNLLDAQQSAGYHSIQWNGCNDAGTTLSSGVYVYCVKSGENFETRKMLFVK